MIYLLNVIKNFVALFQEIEFDHHRRCTCDWNWRALFDEVGMIVQKFVLDYLPYFIFILYSFNSSKSVVQAMFRNCDHSMLTYSFYRRPEVILSLFRLRLRSLILINLFPAVALAIGLDVLLALSGSKESLLVYLIVFICIISTSIFFSIHYLTCYYLLQPYNEFTETKSATYSLIMSLTYGICFAFIYLHMSTYVFGTIMTLFSLVYFVISYRLVYKKPARHFDLDDKSSKCCFLFFH